MTKEICFANAPVEGELMRKVVRLFPELKDQFEQRKQYDEYRFNGYNIQTVITTEALRELTEECWNYSVTLSLGTMEIHNI